MIPARSLAGLLRTTLLASCLFPGGTAASAPPQAAGAGLVQSWLALQQRPGQERLVGRQGLRDEEARPEGTAERSTAALGLAGLAAGTAGFVVCGYAGAVLADSAADDEDDIAAVAGAIWGAGVGTSLGIPLGVHLANGRRGKLGTSVMASVVLAAAGIALAIRADNIVPALAVPVGQIVASIAIERRTARARRQQAGR